MAQYLVESHHTKDECLRELDEMAKKPEVLSRFSWGCMTGDHTGYGVVEAANEKGAKEYIPEFLRSKTEIRPVTRFSTEEIRALHAK